MSRTLAEVEAEAALVAKRSAAFARIWGGHLSAEEDRLAQETIQAVNSELAALEAKRAPPPPAPIPGVAQLTPAAAAERAAEIRARPEWFKGRDADGRRLSEAERQQLVDEHSALNARAAEEG